MKKVLASIDHGLQWTLRVVCIVLFAALVLLVVWQVFSRLVLGNPSAWSEEAARYTFVWVSLIGIAIATAEKADVVMDFLVEKLPLTLQRFADIIAYLLTLVFVVYVMVIGGAEQVTQSWRALIPVLPFTQGPLYLALPVSGVLLALFLVRHIAHAFTREYKGRAEITVDDTAAGS